MPKFLSLPAETLSHIVSYLHLSDLVIIGCTFNKTLVDICMPRLQKRDAALRNARRMATYFGTPAAITQGGFRKLYAIVGLEEQWGSFHDPDRPVAQSLAYLGLEGSLCWLKAKESVDEWCMCDRIEALEEDKAKWSEETKFYGEEVAARIAELVRVTAALGVPVPASFIRYASDIRLRSYMPNSWELAGYAGPVARLIGGYYKGVPFDGYILPFHEYSPTR
jgi:hypothetical protein